MSTRHACRLWPQAYKVFFEDARQTQMCPRKASASAPRGRKRARGVAMEHPVVMITGALTGIGRAAATAFAEEGYRLIVSGRHEDAGQALVAELRALGAEAEFIYADVRQDDDVRALVDRTVERFGRLDAAVNNAGTEGHPGPVTEQSAQSYAATF